MIECSKDETINAFSDRLKGTWDDKVKLDFVNYAAVVDMPADKVQLFMSGPEPGWFRLPPEEMARLVLDKVAQKARDAGVTGKLYAVDYIHTPDRDDVPKFLDGLIAAALKQDVAIVGGECAVHGHFKYIVIFIAGVG